MGRSNRKSIEGTVLNYFAEAPLAAANAVLEIVKGTVRERNAFAKSIEQERADTGPAAPSRRPRRKVEQPLSVAPAPASGSSASPPTVNAQGVSHGDALAAPADLPLAATG